MTVPAGLACWQEGKLPAHLSFCISFGEHVCVGGRSYRPKDFRSNPVGRNIHLSTAKQHWWTDTNKIQNCIIEKYQLFLHLNTMRGKIKNHIQFHVNAFGKII